MLPLKRNRQKSKRDARKRKKEKLSHLLKTDPLNRKVDFTSERTIENILEIDPTNARFHFEFANMISDDKKRAKKHFVEALKLEPENAEFHFGLHLFLEGAPCPCHKALTVHVRKAFEIEPQNPDFLFAQIEVMKAHPNFYTNYDNSMVKIEEIVQTVLKIDPNHAQANFHLAKKKCPKHGYRWDLYNRKAIAADFQYAMNALKGIDSFSKVDRSTIHDMIGTMYEEHSDIKNARKHYDLALLANPLEETRNYWKFFRDHQIDAELLAIVRKLSRSFKLTDESSIVDYFQKYALLTPGYRALLKKNNSVVLALMRKYAKRESQWMFLIPPFDDEYFPKVVTEAIFNFLFHL